MDAMTLFEETVERVLGQNIHSVRSTPLSESRKNFGEYGGLQLSDRTYVLTSRQIDAFLEESLR